MRIREAEFGGGRWLGRGVLVLAVGLTTACGDLTAGGVAEGEAVVTGSQTEEASPSEAPSEARIPVSGVESGAESDQVAPIYEGTVTSTLRVELIVPGSDPVDLSGGAREVTVDIQGEAPVSLGVVEIPTGVYEAVRVTFTAVEASVTSGLPPLGTVTVDFGTAGELAVEQMASVQVDEEQRATATIDLGAPDWIAAAALELVDVVPAAVFGGYVSLSLAVD